MKLRGMVILIFILANFATPVQAARLSKLDVESLKCCEVRLTNENPHISGGGEFFGAMFGLLGGAIAGSVENKTGSELVREYVKSNNIDLEAIVSAEFHKQLADHAVLREMIGESSDQRIQLNIVLYGFRKLAFAMGQSPWIVIQFHVVDSEENILWKKYAYASEADTGIPVMKLKLYFDSPEIFTEAFEVATAIAMRKLLKKIR